MIVATSMRLLSILFFTLSVIGFGCSAYASNCERALLAKNVLYGSYYVGDEFENSQISKSWLEGIQSMNLLVRVRLMRNFGKTFEGTIEQVDIGNNPYQSILVSGQKFKTSLHFIDSITVIGRGPHWKEPK
jgi:hypothetical protein